MRWLRNMNEQETESNWYARRGERVIGPITFNKLQGLVSAGKLRPSDQIRQSSDEGWKAASEMLTFARQTSSSVVEPPPLPTAKPQSVIDKERAEPFLGWYRNRWVYSLRWFYQLPIWLIYGFVWIPIWYVASATPSGGVKNRWDSLSLTGKGIACLPLIFVLMLILRSSNRSFFQHQIAGGKFDQSSNLGQPFTVDLGIANSPGSQQPESVRSSGKASIGRHDDKDVIARLNEERVENEIERNRIVRIREQDEEQKKQVRARSANSADQLRLEYFENYYTVKTPRKSKYPPKPRMTEKFRLYETPVESLETHVDSIRQISVSNDNRLVHFNDRMIRFEDLKPFPTSNSIAINPQQLGYYKSTGYTTIRSQEAFAQVFEKKSNGRYPFHGDSLYLSAQKLIAFVEPSRPVYGDWGTWTPSNAPPDAISFWDYKDNQLVLRNVFSINDALTQQQNGYDLHKLEIGSTETSLVVLASLQASPFSAAGCQLQVWTEKGLQGSCDITYRLGSSTVFANKMAVMESNIAVLYGNKIQVFKVDQLNSIDKRVSPSSKLEASLPVAKSYAVNSTLGFVEFSPDGKFLVAGFPVFSSDQNTDHTLIVAYDTKTWSSVFTLKHLSSSLFFGSFNQSGNHFSVIYDSSHGQSLDVVSLKEKRFSQTFHAKEIRRAEFISDDLVVAGGMTRTIGPNAPDAQRSTKTLDIGLRKINIWNIKSGSLWGRLTLRDVSTFATSHSGGYLFTGKNGYNHSPAILEKWDIRKPSKFVEYSDEFAIERRLEFDELFKEWIPDHDASHSPGTKTRKNVMRNIKVDIAAPPVSEAEFEKLQIGMTYPEVMDLFLGHGEFRASLQADEVVRFVVSFVSAGANDETRELVFEAKLNEEPYLLRLVTKRK